MKNLIIAILSILFLAAFIPARWSTTSAVHTDTTWKPYIVVLRNEYGQETSKWVKGYYNPNFQGDTVATGKVAKFNFTNDNTKSIVGWNKCYLPLAGDSAGYTPPTDANTGFKMNVWGNGNWSANWGANSKPPVDSGQGYSPIFPKSVDSAFWFDFEMIGNTFAFTPNIFISGLNPNYFYKIQWISATQGNTNDYRFYSGVIFQNGNNITDTTQTGYVNGIGKGNTIQTIVSPLVQCNSSGVLNMQLGYYANAYVGYGVISGLTITEYKIE